ncbi:hypothetical protein F5Y10DRAFT_293402 [Nemania abortiva]|nr:hypothetical protein F5Y10DRAFT_293402 [Nemania abortiva]
MAHASTQTDPTANEELPENTDHDIRLAANFQLYTRRWCNFSERQITNTLPPGMLGRLPPEVRFMIYDFAMPDSNNCYIRGAAHDYLTRRQCSGWPNRPPLYFPAPEISRVCREMRQYAMRKYRFVWWSYNFLYYDFQGDITEARIWTEPPGLSGFGFFDFKKDSIKHGPVSVLAVQLVEDATVEWKDPFEAPTVAIKSTRVKRYGIPKEPIIFFTPKESGLWQSLSENGEWKPATLV